DADVALDPLGNELVAEHLHVRLEDRGLRARVPALHALHDLADALLRAGHGVGEALELEVDLVRFDGAAHERVAHAPDDDGRPDRQAVRAGDALQDDGAARPLRSGRRSRPRTRHRAAASPPLRPDHADSPNLEAIRRPIACTASSDVGPRAVTSTKVPF